MYRNGLEVEKMLDEFKPYYSEIPVDGKFILIYPDSLEKNKYSVFKLSGFKLISDATYEPNRRANRWDFTTLIISEIEFDTVDTSNSLILQYKQNKVCRFNR